jgi:hypothetical protein
MATHPQESKLDNLKVRPEAKEKVIRVAEAIQAKRGPHAERPTLTEAVLIMADHFLATA